MRRAPAAVALAVALALALVPAWAAGCGGAAPRAAADAATPEAEEVRGPEDAGIDAAEDAAEPAPDADAAAAGDEDAGAAAPPELLLSGATLAGGGVVTVAVAEGVVTAVTDGPWAGPPPPGATLVDLTGRWLAPAVIDSHVHVLYLPRGPDLARGGVAAAVDHAAPLAFFTSSFAPLRVLGSGPMITAVGGYPTQSWGAGGYGWECPDAACAEAAVSALVAEGAGLVKIALAGGPTLPDDALAAVVARAHALGRLVSAHALGAEAAARAAAVGADVLAHTPTAPLPEATLEAWAGRAVISTLDAFGGGPAAVQNLAALRARGATVLYGTDFGNSADVGVSAAEIGKLLEAGLDGAAVLEAATRAPARFWGLDDLGEIAPGKAASLLVLAADPRLEPLTLAEPVDVWLDGVRVGPPGRPSP